jgi:preprotein translocase subunit SecA
MTFVKKTVAAAAVLALVACATMMAGKKVDVTLTGAEEVPPVSTAARGSGSFTIGDDGAVSGSVTTSGVNGTMAHIHMAPKGQNGGVIVPLTKDGDKYSAPAGAKLNEAQMTANKGGEVRGQLNP